MVHRRLLALVGTLRGPLAAGVVVGWVVFAARIAQAVAIGVVLGRILTGDSLASISGLWIWIAVIVVVRGVLVWARDFVAQVAAEQIKLRLRDRLYSHLIELGPGYQALTRSGEAQATVVDGIEALENYYSRYLPQLVVCLTAPVVVVVWMFSRDVWIGATVLLALLAVPLVPRLWDRLLTERGQEHWDAYAELGADYLDSMQGMSTLKSFNASAQRRRVMRERSDHLTRSTMRQLAISLIDSGLTALGVQLGVALAVGVGVVRVANGDLDLSVLLIVLVMTGECFRPFRELSAYWHAGFLGISAAAGIGALLDARPATPDRADAWPLPAGVPHAVELDGVTFTYPGRTEPALHDLSVALRPGERVAIVGRSGAGKSTIVNLLLRFVPPDRGRVLVGGHDVAEVTGDSLREQIALVSQDTYLFHGTVADNLRLAKPDATQEDLVTAARAANADGFIRALPLGYESRIGERGLTLSGGQRQRLAIARALLKDAPVLVLDEATSAVDADNEAGIVAALDRLSAGRTTLVIAHRLNTVRNADRILVLEDGRLVEDGGHDELLARSGTYARLVHMQRASTGMGAA